MSEKNEGVRVWTEDLTIPTYEPAAPDKNPMFLEKRVYQGSSGKVYPLPFYDRISEEKTDRVWRAVWMENEFLRVMILPEIGGRIHIGQDKTNGYDFFYRQNVIKPALVGLAGPWISGGVEFNWPQHHRPATFMPVDFHLEEHPDGSKTLWLSDHDPIERMKGMHGVCLRPGSSAVEVKVRAYNRTPHVQTFLWWANVAARVHEGYQSFFPPDVTCVADHAKRAMSRFPLCEGHYYGVDYAARGKRGVPLEEAPAHFVPPRLGEGSKPSGIPDYSPDDLSWYANIPVPTSYMCIGSEEDFFGGYDYAKQAGLVHVANRHISPGKKQWTWGNQEFGYAWDRNLTDSDGPYIELMAGVYTDNQPDFSFLQPGETKTWSQYWYPIQKIGPAQKANVKAAAALRIENARAKIGVTATQRFSGAVVSLWRGSKKLADWQMDLAPDQPRLIERALPRDVALTDLRLSVQTADGEELLSYQPKPRKTGALPAPAAEPPLPELIPSADELYLTGQHLSQYRHATRSAAAYWREALRRDPGDARCNNALGVWHLRRGEFALAEPFFRRAIDRLTSRNPNPADGEPFYQLGLCLRFLNRDEAAYDAFYKATWNQAWQGAGYHALAELDCCRRDWPTALDHLDRSLRLNTDNLRARDLRAMALRQLGREDEATRYLDETLRLDPLDWQARRLRGEPLGCNAPTHLDLALDCARAGFFSDAIAILQAASSQKEAGARPLVQYYLAYFFGKLDRNREARAASRAAAACSSDYCFPSRLEDIIVLEAAIVREPKDACALYYLGNLFYDKRRYEEAIALWERSVRLDGVFSIAWRNLGIAYFNIERSSAKARKAYERAIKANPTDARLLYERDQLWKRIGEPVSKRLRELERRMDLIRQRDDLSIELCALYNQAGQPEKALAIVSQRKFQPWEGGEGQALGQHVRTHLLLARGALKRGEASEAVRCCEAALSSPQNLGEAKHLLANQSDIHYWLGVALEAQGDKNSAKRHWNLAANFKGDFQEMSVRAYSEMTYFSARALERLGKSAAALKLFRELLDFAKGLAASKAQIDYFATSLPTMLLFEDDLQRRQHTAALFLQAQAECGLGKRSQAKKRLTEILQCDPGHAGAADLLTQL